MRQTGAVRPAREVPRVDLLPPSIRRQRERTSRIRRRLGVAGGALAAVLLGLTLWLVGPAVIGGGPDGLERHGERQTHAL